MPQAVFVYSLSYKAWSAVITAVDGIYFVKIVRVTEMGMLILQLGRIEKEITNFRGYRNHSTNNFF